MLNNLLSGAIGSIVGVVGAFLAAGYAFTRTREHERMLAWHQRAIETSGALAHSLVEFYLQLKLAAPLGRADSEVVDVDHLRDAEQDLARHITVDAPLLDEPLECRMRDVRDDMRALIRKGASTVTVGDLRRLTVKVRKAGDDLRDFRRSKIDDAKPQWSRAGRSTPAAGRRDDISAATRP